MCESQDTLTGRETNGRESRAVGRAVWTLATAALLLWAAGCESSESPTGAADGSDTARIQVLLTDLPLEAIEIAEVWISRIYLVGGGQGQVDLFSDSDAPHHLDLLQLQDGVTAEVTEEVEVPAGSYGQLRFVVDSGRIVLAEDYSFSDGSRERTLGVPSGFVRVNLKGEGFPDGNDEANGGDEQEPNDTNSNGQEPNGSDEEGGLELEGGTSTVVVVDFDVAASFIFTGPPWSPNGVHLHPVLHEISREVR